MHSLLYYQFCPLQNLACSYKIEKCSVVAANEVYLDFRLLSLISVYCIFGALFNKYVMEMDGADVIPHKQCMVKAFNTGQVCFYFLRGYKMVNQKTIKK